MCMSIYIYIIFLKKSYPEGEIQVRKGLRKQIETNKMVYV
jgi:hypothetical protein